ncbi:unnamed protein product, partial [Ectocarpus fasciculatus]
VVAHKQEGSPVSGPVCGPPPGEQISPPAGIGDGSAGAHSAQGEHCCQDRFYGGISSSRGAVSSRTAVPTLEKTGLWHKKLAFVGASTLGQHHRSASPCRAAAVVVCWSAQEGIQCGKESLPPLALDRRHSRRRG